MLSAQFGAVHKTGGISFSGITLILLAAHKCAFCWPVSRASVTATHKMKDNISLPCVKGGGPRLVVEGLFHRIIQYECYVNNPSVSYADSSPCTGEPSPCIICISFYRLTFWEPRDYRVVFVIQKHLRQLTLCRCIKIKKTIYYSALR